MRTLAWPTVRKSAVLHSCCPTSCSLPLFLQLVVAVLGADPAASSCDPAALIQAAAALGSFAASEEGLAAVLAAGGIPRLLRVLTASGDDRVVEAAVRALKAVSRVSCLNWSASSWRGGLRCRCSARCSGRCCSQYVC